MHYCEFFVISDFSLWSVVTTLLWRDTDELLLVLRRIFLLTADLLDFEADEMIEAREMTGPRTSGCSVGPAGGSCSRTWVETAGAEMISVK